MGCASSNTVVETLDSVPPVALRAKTVIERDFHKEYDVEDKLGQGAYGVVYGARRTSRSKEQFAVKVIDIRDPLSKHLDFDDTRIRVDQRRRRNITNEALMLSAISGHDNVCHMIEHFIHGGLAYIVLERFDRPLSQALASCESMSEEALRPFFRGMLTGIASVHARRIVHRDIKPDNFMCSGPDNTIKLCDFGLACALATLGSEPKGIFGTSPYIAPEMLEYKDYGTKVDVWSFGVVVHVLFCGCFPYTPREWTDSSMKAAILKGFPTSKILDASERDRTPSGMSEEAKLLIINLLSRSALKRPTCREALKGNFFTSQSLSQVCLRQKFESAKLCGAFDHTCTAKAGISDVDLRLRRLQGRRYEFAAVGTRSPSSEVSTDIGSTLGKIGQSSESVEPDQTNQLGSGRSLVVVYTTAHGLRGCGRVTEPIG